MSSRKFQEDIACPHRRGNVSTNRWEVTLLRYVLTRFAIWILSVLIVMLVSLCAGFWRRSWRSDRLIFRKNGDVAFIIRSTSLSASAGLNVPLHRVILTSGTSHGQPGKFADLAARFGRWSPPPLPFPSSWRALFHHPHDVIAIPLGMIAAMNQNSRLDYAILGSALFLSGRSRPTLRARC